LGVEILILQVVWGICNGEIIHVRVIGYAVPDACIIFFKKTVSIGRITYNGLTFMGKLILF
jgi:hypothetical protein